MKELIDIIEESFSVFVGCQTYNHKDYIKDALRGFAIQMTSFPFVCAIIDDFSTDGTQAAINEWITDECDTENIQQVDLDLAIIYKVKHRTNRNCTFVFYFLKKNLYKEIETKDSLIEPLRSRSKYVAICEGDDYWTYPSKLQEQVDFLDSHNDYSAISSNALVLLSADAPMRHFGSTKSKDFFQLQEIIPHRKFHTASVVYRLTSMQNCPFHGKGNWDTFMWCCLLTQGPIHYEGNVTCVYRKQLQGITESTPKIGWLLLTSKWADALTEFFVPQHVRKKYVVRSVTRDIIRVYIHDCRILKEEDKDILKSLYLHSFSIWNSFYDLKEVIIQSIKKLIR